MIPSYSPFSFLPKPGYLARVESLRPQLDSLSLRVYSFVCDGWEVVAVSLNSSINGKNYLSLTGQEIRLKYLFLINTRNLKLQTV